MNVLHGGRTSLPSAVTGQLGGKEVYGEGKESKGSKVYHCIRRGGRRVGGSECGRLGGERGRKL